MRSVKCRHLTGENSKDLLTVSLVGTGAYDNAIQVPVLECRKASATYVEKKITANGECENRNVIWRTFVYSEM